MHVHYNKILIILYGLTVLRDSYEPYPQLRHKIKMAAIVCTEILWRGYCFAMNDIKKSKNISGEAYIQSSNANARVLLNLSISIG